MERFTSAVLQSLASGNLYAALYLGITLPDICARLEAENAQTSAQKYVAWFNQYLAHHYRVKIGASMEYSVFLSGEDLYALRCSMLQEGHTDIGHQRMRQVLDRFHFTIGSSHCNRVNSTLQLDVPIFCEQVCSAVDAWYKDFKENHPDKIERLSYLTTIHDGTSKIIDGVYIE